jgi:REP element-mobilizing transposase RayT
MPRAMILAYHVILSAYGFWLPNDPRGSWSDFCASWELFRYGGKATKVETRRSVAHVRHDRAKRLEMKSHLKYAPVRWSGVQARAIARGFARAVAESGYRIVACSILHDHVHLIVVRCDRPIGRIVTHLKGRATQQLRAEGIHPFERFGRNGASVPTMWAGKYWKVFIDNDEHLEKAIDYVDRNPQKEGKRRQDWNFVGEARGGRLSDPRRKRRR